MRCHWLLAPLLLSACVVGIGDAPGGSGSDSDDDTDPTQPQQPTTPLLVSVAGGTFQPITTGTIAGSA